MASKKEQVIQSIEVTYDTAESVYDAIENICNLDLTGAIGMVNMFEDLTGENIDIRQYDGCATLYILRQHLQRIKDDLLALHPQYQST